MTENPPALLGRDSARPWPIRVAILIFDDVEVLDFAGPFEVFGVTRTSAGAPFDVFTVALAQKLVSARNGLQIVPHSDFLHIGRVDVFVVPGGMGARREMRNAAMLEAVRNTSDAAQITLSVCTGALLLGAAGLLRDLAATTHYGAIDALRALDCAVVLPDARVVDNGGILTSAGISAGIDAALYLVARIMGQCVAEETARYMQYDWGRREVEVRPPPARP
jgi:transcriptional regulator GlxA family with amidase domain